MDWSSALVMVTEAARSFSSETVKGTVLPAGMTKLEEQPGFALETPAQLGRGNRAIQLDGTELPGLPVLGEIDIRVPAAAERADDSEAGGKTVTWRHHNSLGTAGIFRGMAANRVEKPMGAACGGQGEGIDCTLQAG